MSFVPELVDSWEDGDGSVPDVAGVVHLAALHLHLGILQPQSDVAVIDVQRSLVNGTSPETRGSSDEGKLYSKDTCGTVYSLFKHKLCATQAKCTCIYCMFLQEKYFLAKGTIPLDLLQAFLPLCVFYPVTDDGAILSDVVLKPLKEKADNSLTKSQKTTKYKILSSK